jgi:type IV pilus assembly protein PilA
VKGFTLLEMLIVLAIIGIMLALTLPSGGGKLDQARIVESINLVKRYQPKIESYYAANNEFPADNASLGIPVSTSISGNYMKSVKLVEGALHLKLGNKIGPRLKDKVISFRPVFVPDEPDAPVSWICGNDSAPDNMVAAGENRTNIENTSLPVVCR